MTTNNQFLLRECIKQEYEESEGYANESEYFEHFATSQVLKDCNLSEDEIDEGNTGGGNDGGCDGIYIFLNGDLLTEDQIETLSVPRGAALKLCIVQAKNELGFKENAVQNWKTVSENLLNMSSPVADYHERYNERTIDGFTLFRDAVTKLIRSQIKIQIVFYYVTLATELHPNVVQQADELQGIVKRYYPNALTDVQFIGADELMELYNRDGEVSTILELSDQPISLGDGNYVALVNLCNYYRFIIDEANDLRKGFFEANVRDYQGHNSVNTCIADSLRNNECAEDFWWLNNGITILSSEIKLVTNKSLQLVDPEVVNGLQTSREIFNYFSDNHEALKNENRNVLIRIIKPNTEESRDNIIFATNNQTNIPKSSLRVTDPIHLQIEMYFKSRGLYYDRRKNYYRNQGKKTSEIIGVPFLAQCLISLLLKKPDYARARPSTLLTDDDTYAFLYERNQDLEVFYNSAKAGLAIKKNLRASENMTPAERSDILFYLLYAVVSNHLKKETVTSQDMKTFDIDALDPEEVNAVKDSVFTIYKALGGNGRVARSGLFTMEVIKMLEGY